MLGLSAQRYMRRHSQRPAGVGAGYILSGIAQDMDFFIDEYLRVNAGAC